MGRDYFLSPAETLKGFLLYNIDVVFVYGMNIVEYFMSGYVNVLVC